MWREKKRVTPVPSREVVLIRAEMATPPAVCTVWDSLSFKRDEDTQMEIPRGQLGKGRGSAREMEEANSPGSKTCEL
jgi:hypothetical protein